jgi:hypothetical protein
MDFLHNPEIQRELSLKGVYSLSSRSLSLTLLLLSRPIHMTGEDASSYKTVDAD